MTYDIYRYIFVGAAIACVVMLVITIVLFFVLKIPAVIGELSGRTAKKAIADIRKQNMSANTDNIGSEKLTDKISTDKLIEQNRIEYSNNETTLLNTGNETIVLNSENETTVLSSYSGQTAILNMSDMETNVNSVGYVNVELDITYIHSTEIID